MNAMRALFTVIWLLVVFVSILQALRKPARQGPTIIARRQPHEPEFVPEQEPEGPPPRPAFSPVYAEPASTPAPQPAPQPVATVSELLAPAPPVVEAPTAAVGAWLADLDEARRGIILAEILGPPKGLLNVDGPEWWSR